MSKLLNLINIELKDKNPKAISTKKKTSKEERDLNGLSSLGIKYPILRDHPLHSCQQWLQSKIYDDGAESLWRIHDQLYDFSKFLKIHPGGQDWLKLTKGTDITEAFEVHHLSQTPKGLLSEYYVKDAKSRRNSPFTFHNDGFYNVMRKNIYQKLQTLPSKPVHRSKFFTDLLFFSYISTSLLATYFNSFIIGTVSGVALGLTAIAAHNFFHKKDNFRMYYFDFTLMGSREWRISHALSHHLYTNTINDLEISYLEPFLQYLPTKKTIFTRYASWFYSPIIYAFAFIGYFIRTFIQILINGEALPWQMFLPFSVPLLMFTITGQSVIFCAIMFLWIIISGSFYFSLVGVNAAHHHPDIFHDGDQIRHKDKMDWGVYQLDAVADRRDINGSHFLVLTNFGDHALHHLFPTIDHGLLEYLYPTFLATCKRFGVKWKLTSQMELVKGQYRQLANITPNNFKGTA